MAYLLRSWATQLSEEARALADKVGRKVTQSPVRAPMMILVADHEWDAHFWQREHGLQSSDYLWARSYQALSGLDGPIPVFLFGDCRCLSEDFFYRRLLEVSGGEVLTEIGR